MDKKLIYIGLATIFVILALIIGYILCGDEPSFGFIIDKYEQDNKQYVLLDNKEWVRVTPDQFIGLEVGDFYEGSMHGHFYN